jgi:hypothetical protein
MSNEIYVELPVNGNRNAVVKAYGILSGDMPRQVLVTFESLVHQDRAPEKLKIESFNFAIQEKLGFMLYWRVGGEMLPILPLESRGYLNWASIYSLHSPEGADAIMFESIGWTGPWKAFLFELDIEKQ